MMLKPKYCRNKKNQHKNQQLPHIQGKNQLYHQALIVHMLQSQDLAQEANLLVIMKALELVVNPAALANAQTVFMAAVLPLQFIYPKLLQQQPKHRPQKGQDFKPAKLR